MTLAAFLCALAALALFGLSNDGHHQQRLSARITPRRQARMRAAAWAGTAMAFPFAILAGGWVFGPILWCGLLMLSAGIVFLLLNLLPTGVRRRR